MEDRPRRATRGSRQEQREGAIERLKAARAGKSGLQVELQESVFEEVDDDRSPGQRMDEVDFVVDDDGNGYVDQGGEWWEHDEDDEDGYGSEEMEGANASDEDARPSKSSKRDKAKGGSSKSSSTAGKDKAGKSANNATSKPQPAGPSRIHKMFAAQASAVSTGPSARVGGQMLGGAELSANGAVAADVGTSLKPDEDALLTAVMSDTVTPVAKRVKPSASTSAGRPKPGVPGSKTRAALSDIALFGSAKQTAAAAAEAPAVSAPAAAARRVVQPARPAVRKVAAPPSRAEVAAVEAPHAMQVDDNNVDESASPAKEADLFEVDAVDESSMDFGDSMDNVDMDQLLRAEKLASSKSARGTSRAAPRMLRAVDDDEPAAAPVAKPANATVVFSSSDASMMDTTPDVKSRASAIPSRAIATVASPAQAAPAPKQAAPTVALASAATPLQLPTVSSSSSALPLKTDEAGVQYVQFYWLDAYEDMTISPGLIYLIGKVWSETDKRHVSCCVVVHNNERNIFILPREHALDANGISTAKEVTIEDVEDELDNVRAKYRIEEWRSKPVQRLYAFGLPGVPAYATYIKVKYSAALPALAAADQSGKTYSHIFGTTTSCLERFLVKRALMGPCWLKVPCRPNNGAPETWCALEAICDNPKSISKIAARDLLPPPLVVCSLAMKTILNASKHKHEVAVVSLVLHTNVSAEGEMPTTGYEHLTLVAKPANRTLPFGFANACKTAGFTLESCDSEQLLLNRLMNTIGQADPDMLIGHNFVGFDLDVLLHRMQDLSVRTWSKLGRLRRSQMPRLSNHHGSDASFGERIVLSGRLTADMYLQAKDLVKARTYMLTELALLQLGEDRPELDIESISQRFNDSAELIQLCRLCEKDAVLSVRLAAKMMVIPLTRQLTNIAGNLWSRTLLGGRAERNEFYLLHEFSRPTVWEANRKFIPPDKIYASQVRKAAAAAAAAAAGKGNPAGAFKKRKKAAYAGGLVLEPKKGFYDRYILLLDFNSLYPSIIMEYNICFTTVDKPQPVSDPTGLEDGNGQPLMITPPAELPAKTRKDGLLPRVLSRLVQQRALAKKEMANHPEQKQQWDIRQRALKLTANSMYGCLGFTNSRFYAKHLAELITGRGRDILQSTVDLVQQQLNLEVIYGDTDSIMINTQSIHLPDVLEVGQRVKKQVNDRYKQLVIEMDGIFKSMLLLKKKKYAALSVHLKDGAVEMVNGAPRVSRETKGLDIVRRDWCDLAHDAGNFVLNQILSDNNAASIDDAAEGVLSKDALVERIRTYLLQLAADVRTGKTLLNKFVINKGLTKNPEEYADKKSQPHVQVALRLKEQGKAVRAGDTVPYVICSGSQELGPADRAYHPDEILRAFSRAIAAQAQLPSDAPLPQLDIQTATSAVPASAIACELNVDVEWYLKYQVHPVISRLCDPIEGTSAALIAEYLGLDTTPYTHRTSSNGMACPRPNCTGEFRAVSVMNRLTIMMRGFIDEYYQGWMKCDDAACQQQRTRQLSVNGRKCLNPGCKGTMRLENTDTKLYTQLLYFQRLFDLQRAFQKIEDSEQRALAVRMIEPYRADIVRVHQHVNATFNKSARQFVNLRSLFSFLRGPTGVSSKPGK
ncbi:DNA polymerase alpha subunit I [Capsaspora owczarzaki ATCC 30864]|uniref:DNA polymerase n=1 Tax=Capsaspora owczarzaki (strain ATCC 30864) TaxID=595528 RepID=A0A0D2WJW5_CAPO3|nr:DNA polymerase alpha subunit I [Capsaspora owczarzaki ATCC 30864]